MSVRDGRQPAAVPAPIPRPVPHSIATWRPQNGPFTTAIDALCRQSKGRSRVALKGIREITHRSAVEKGANGPERRGHVSGQRRNGGVALLGGQQGSFGG